MNNVDIIQQAIDVAPRRPGLTFGQFVPSQISGASNVDGVLPVSYTNHHRKFAVLFKSHLHHVMIDSLLAANIGSDLPVMVITEQMGYQHAEMLMKDGIAFLDTAGNAFLDLPGMHLSVTGRKLAASLRKPTPGRAFQTSGLKLIYAILTDVQSCGNLNKALINQSFRAINQQTGISLGSIGWILSDLRDAGFIIMDGKERLLVDRKKLMQKWVANYADRLRPKLVNKQFSATKADWWKSVHLNGPAQLWGGEVAASKLMGFLKPQVVTIYTSTGIDDLILDAGLRVDPEGDVVIMDSFWKTPIAYKDCTHPLLVYADLLASDIDRNIETAQRIYNDYLLEIIDADK